MGDIVKFTSTHGGNSFAASQPENFLSEIVNKWGKTSLLDEYGAGSERGFCLATCLEAQRLNNEQITSERLGEDGVQRFAQWKRNNIPLIVRLFRVSEAMKRNQFVNYFEDISMQSMLVFKTRFDVPKTHNHVTNLDAECAFLETFSNAIAREIDTTFRDRRNSEVIFRGLDMLEDKTVIMYYA